MRTSIGIDFGTNSARAVLVNCNNGEILSTCTVNYPSGTQGVLLDKNDDNVARQNPADYVYALEHSIRGALEAAEKMNGFQPDSVIGIGIDATSSSIIPLDAKNIPLGTKAEWKNHLAAQCWLWKDHVSYAEAEEMTRLIHSRRKEWLSWCGAAYSSEWFWAKILHCARNYPEVFEAADSWVELCDYIPAVLIGIDDSRQIPRSACAAGHKALFNTDWGGLPDLEFLGTLDKRLPALHQRLFSEVIDDSQAAGTLCKEWAERLGLPEGIAIAPGKIDVHAGAVGCGVRSGKMMKVIGTSSCDCTVLPLDQEAPQIPGITGVARASVLPGFYGIEAGQAAVGDIFKWWVEIVCEGTSELHGKLTKEAEKLHPGETGLLALDWNNGNRNLLDDPMLSGLLVGQTLHTTRAEIYRALIEGTAFGARAILERFNEHGIAPKQIICTGGIANKSPLLMQIYADVLNCELQVAQSTEATALGAAIAGAAVADPDYGILKFQDDMVQEPTISYKPIPENHAIYTELYSLYRDLHDSFGGVRSAVELQSLMKELRKLRVREH